MSNLPSVKAKDFVKVIKKLGFYLDRQKGSHAIAEFKIKNAELKLSFFIGFSDRILPPPHQLNCRLG